MSMAEQVYEADGHEVTILETPSNVYGYIDGKGVELNDADLSGVPEQFHPNGDTKSVKRFLSYLVDTDTRVCGKCGSTFEAGTGGTFPFAGIQCPTCDNEDKYCPDGSEHSFEVINPSQRHNARVATKKKCVKCGYRIDEPPTG